MREKVIAGNWKMFTGLEDGKRLVTGLMDKIRGLSLSGKRIIVFPPFTHLASLAELAGGSSVRVGAQNCYFEKQGAFTGEISTGMIKSAGAEYVLVGHSERRQYFNEGNEMLNRKVAAALGEGLTPVYCCGETLEEREQNRQFEVVGQQISEGLFSLSENGIAKTIVAYEPVWAIGTGKTASPEQAQEIHAFIRGIFEKKYGTAVSSKLIILYGGSVKPDNAATLFSQADIDGGLVGGASLKADDFAAIIEAA